MGVVRGFRELDVYRRAFDAALQIYELSKTFPAVERYSLTDQIRRASRSVGANIAEAWRKRPYPAHFASKLWDADGEAAETQVWLDFALAHDYIHKNLFATLDDLYDRICAQLRKMMDNSDSWCKHLHPTTRSRSPEP